MIFTAYFEAALYLKGIRLQPGSLVCKPTSPNDGYVTIMYIETGKSETSAEALRSILSQMEFSHQVQEYSDKLGVPFRFHLYVPELHPITKEPFCEREDEAHLLKVCSNFVQVNLSVYFVFFFWYIQRIAHSTRMGGPAGIQLERYMEALHDPDANLTYTAMTGVRKQSVVDAERLFSAGLVEFMERKGYEFEAEYVRVILDWRRACGERGLSELQRCRYNYHMLNYMLDELMPWHDEYDFSHIEVNRYIIV